MNYSPLRYPGGKTKIAPMVKLLIEKSGMKNVTYVEPFAGGAGVSLELLFSGEVDHIVINDYDKAIYSIWRAIIENTNQFVELIENTEVSVDEWYRQKNIYTNQSNRYSVELAFATFFLNRTNRSGILAAGPIGGYEQNGNYLIDARYNKEELINRILRIAKRKDDISVYNKDIRSFMKNYLHRYSNIFLYLDPPYYKKGQELYKNFFVDKDHKEIADLLENEKSIWMVTYDAEPEIAKLYEQFSKRYFDLSYSVAEKKKASEVMILCTGDLWPNKQEMQKKKIKLNLREKMHPLKIYATGRNQTKLPGPFHQNQRKTLHNNFAKKSLNKSRC